MARRLHGDRYGDGGGARPVRYRCRGHLAARGVRVVPVDRDPQVIQRVSGQLPGAVCAEVSGPDTLRQVGGADVAVAVIAMRSSLEDSMMCTLAAAELGIAQICAAASNPKHARILSALGAHQVILPAQLAAEETAHQATGKALAQVLVLGEDTAVAVPAVPGVVAAVRAGTDISVVQPGAAVAGASTLLLVGAVSAVERLMESGDL